MDPNGIQKERSVVRDAIDQIVDHGRLASLEWSYEKNQTLRRLVAIGLSVFFAFFGFAMLQVAIVHLLMKTGLSLGAVCLILAMVYGGLSFACCKLMGVRDARVGLPFEGTRRELKETVRWIQKLF